MKKNSFKFLLISFALMLATLTLFAQEPPLEAGTYYISSSSGVADYPTFRAAVEDLVERGISGPVIFDIAPGTYNDGGEEKEQIIITEIEGASEENTVTFINSDPTGAAVISVRTKSWYWGDPEKPAIEAMVYLIGAKHIIFDNLSFRKYTGYADSSIGISTGSEHITITRCTFNYGGGDLPGVSIKNSDNILIDGNNFPDSRVVVTGTSERYVKGIVVKNNKFVNAYSSFNFNFADSFIFANNVVECTGSSHGTRGGTLEYTRGAFRFENNRIFFTESGQNGVLWGESNPGGTHIDDGKKAIFANNMIGGNINQSSNYTAGIRVHATVHNVGFYYNSILLEATGTSTKYACISFAMPNNTNIDIVNNSLAYTGGGSGYLIIGTPNNFRDFDYNNYYTNGTNFVYLSNNDIPNLASLQAIDRKNLNSKVGDPKYVTNTDLHTFGVQLWQTGTPIEGLEYDIDGDLRDSEHPCIGADEYTPLIDNDLAATFISGPDVVTVGEPAEFTIGVENSGRLFQVAYTIRLMRDGDILLESFVIEDPIWPEIPAEVVIKWTPTYPGTFRIYAKIVLANDENLDNNSTPKIGIIILPSTSAEIPEANLVTGLKGNYPNPFNPETTINYTLKDDAKDFEIKIFNIQGQLVRTLVSSGSHQRGEHSIVWNGLSDTGEAVPTGIYFCRMTSSTSNHNLKMMLLK
jgi:hypothetical protein